MPAAKAGTGASRKRGASASQNGKFAVSFRDLKLSIPSEPPGDLAFSVTDGQLSDAIREIFGPDQYLQIRQSCKEAALNLNETFTALDSLLGKCFEKWNADAGE